MTAALTTPAPAAPPPFTAGTGSAKATLVSPAVAAGNLAITVIAGESSSSFRDRSARGSSTSVDIPVLRATNATRVCGQLVQGIGSRLPPVVAADTSANNDSKPVSTRSGQDQGLDQSAEAQPEAHATSTTKLASTGVPPLASVTAAIATTDVRADGRARARMMTARSSIGDVEVLGGLVTLKGLRWDLQQVVSGDDDRADREKVGGGFSVQSITVGLPGAPAVAIPIPTTGDAADAFARANALLAKVGVQLRLPRQVDNPESRAHAITPLTVALGGRDWLAGPVLGTVLTGPQFQQLSQLALHTLFDAKDCKQLGGLMQALGPDVNAQYNYLGSNAPLLVAVLAGALGGTGEIQLNLGGVSTTVDDTYYPALDFAPPLLGQVLTPPSPVGATLGAAPATSAPPTAITTRPAVATACRTSSPAGRPGCWLGHGPAGALAAGGFTVALLAADEVFRRRYRRSRPTGEVTA
jgi:hypothetical protein